MQPPLLHLSIPFPTLFTAYCGKDESSPYANIGPSGQFCLIFLEPPPFTLRYGQNTTWKNVRNINSVIHAKLLDFKRMSKF